MLRNVSYNNKQIYREIDEVVGKPFSLKERIKRGGIGMGHLLIEDASISIQNLLLLDNSRNRANIEIRPSGIIVGFRSLLESYAWIVPFHKLTIYKGNATVYSLYKDTQFMKITVRPTDKKLHRFMKKIATAKADFLASQGTAT